MSRSVFRHSTAVINGAHSFHTWTIWKTKRYLLAIVSFSGLLSVKQKTPVQVPQNSWQHYVHFAQTRLLHKAIISFFSSYHGPDQEENWDVNHEKDPATKQLFQLCQIPFMGHDSDSSLLLSLIAAEMPLMGKTLLLGISFPSNGGPAWEEEQDFSREQRDRWGQRTVKSWW